MVLHLLYREAAEEYLRKLKLRDFMESTPQATQRKITLESLDLVNAKRPEVQVFNELLVQYPRSGRKKPGQVVPDNMVIIHDKPIKADGSYDLPLQPVKPFWVLEYVSKHNRRKDWVDNLPIYAQDVQAAYYLVFEPEIQELILHRLEDSRYVTVLPNEHGRFAIPELELELALLDGWVRYWFRGELVPLPPDLLRDLEHTREQLTEERRLRALADQKAQDETRLRELAEKRAQDEIRQRELAEKKALEERRLRESLEAQIALLHAQLKAGGQSP